MKTIKKVLLVDDSDATIFFNKTILSKSGCVDEILIAKNGLEALNIIKEGIVPDLIFLDINMPVMNGWEFLEEFRQLENPIKDIKIILLIGSPLLQEDEDYAFSIPQIKEFRDKMLSRVVIDDIITKYYQNDYVLVE